MKRSIFVFLVLSACLITFIACENPSNNYYGGSSSGGDISSYLFDMSALKYYKADIDSKTAAIGIIDASSSRAIDTTTSKVLVKQDEGSSETTEVTFSVVNTAEGSKSLTGSDLKIGDKVTQGEISGKIDKMYVTDDYTFISYITIDIDKLLNYEGLSKNTYNGSTSYSGNISNYQSSGSEYLSWSFNNGSDDITINYSSSNYGGNGQYNCGETFTIRNSGNEEQAPGENDGVTKFDISGYRSSKLRESFIIDNKTGLIYSVGDYCFGFQAGVAYEESLGPVAIESKDNGELEIKQLVQNPSAYISHVFKDKYGQYYILNDSFDEQADNICYFTRIGEYVPTKSGEALHIDIQEANGSFMPYSISSIKVVGENFAETSVGADDTYEINYSQYYTDYGTPSGIAAFNRNQNNVSYHDFCNNNKGFMGTYVRLADGYLTAYYSDHCEIYFYVFDISTYNTYIIDITESLSFISNKYSQACVFLPLSNGNFLIGENTSSGSSLYTLKAVDLNSDKIAVLATYVCNKDGQTIDSSRQNTTAGKTKYADFVGKYSDNPNIDADFYIEGEGEDGKYYNFYYKYKSGYDESTVSDLITTEKKVLNGGTELLDNIKISSEIGYTNLLNEYTSAFDCKFTKYTSKGSTSYKIVDNGDGTYSATPFATFVAEKKNITLQPLNK